jgi:hypothetical protein
MCALAYGAGRLMDPTNPKSGENVRLLLGALWTTAAGLLGVALFLGTAALMIVLAFVYPMAAVALGAAAFLIWLISRVNTIATAARERGEWARAQRNFYRY